MASWRVKGYVSDSEDEDGGVDLNNSTCDKDGPSATSNIPVLGSEAVKTLSENVHNSPRQTDVFSGFDQKQPTPYPATAEAAVTTSTAGRLQEGSQHGLELKKGISPSPSTPDKRTDLQGEDSPLSTPPDSPQSLPSISKILIGEGEFTLIEQPDSIQAPQRTFRQRTANQLQPYTIDRAKHLQEWTALGMKPVPAPRGRSPGPGNAERATADDSQFEESQSQTGGSNSLDVMDLDLSPQLAQSLRHDVYDLDAEEELPDLARLLERRSPRSMEKSRRSMVLFDLPSANSQQHSGQGRRKSSMQNDQQDSLPSPPPSLDDQLPRSLDMISDQDQDNFPRAVPSSTPRPRKRLVIEDDTQSVDENQASTPLPIMRIDDDTTSDESASGNEIAQTMQRRIKGVLPASWWTVEMAQKSLAARKKQIARQHTSRTPHVGVAQLKESDRNRPRLARDHDFEELLSSQNSENEVIIAPVATQGNTDDLPDHPPLLDEDEDEDDMEMIEEDEIDRMLAPQSRRRGSHGIPYVKPTASSVNRTIDQARGRNELSPGKVKSHRPRKRLKAKSTRGRFHVLDAPSLREPRQNLPSFLKVASRQAKSRPKSSGMLASRKYFHLDSDDEFSSRNLDPKAFLASASRQSREGWVAKRQAPKSNSAIRPPTLEASKGGHPPAQLQWRTGTTENQDQYTATESTVPSEKIAALGYLIQCGSTDDATLRLTRLQSLLPLTNRSGSGKFVTNHLLPREAQVEVLQPATRLGVRRRIRSIAATQAVQPARNTPHHSIATGTLQPQPKEALPNMRGKKKQTPIQRPKLHQRSLVAPSPNTKNLADLIGRIDVSVRDTLEMEFNTHQAAWFQSSRQDIAYSSQETQQHFYTFIEVLKSYLPVALQDADEDREARELRSFIHRLIPNRGQIGASGQVGNKTRSVRQYDVLVAQNVFELHKCLLNLAPGAAPRPRVLEMKVNFVDAHEEICFIALSTWKDICRMHTGDSEIVDGLASWLYSMLLQLANRWIAAETDAQKEVANLTHLVDERVLRRVVEHNQSRVCALLRKVVTAFTDCVQEATGVVEARSLFKIGDFLQVLRQFSSIEKLDLGIIEGLSAAASLYVTQCYASMERGEIAQLLDGLHKSLFALASRQRLPYATSYSLSKSLFVVAKAAVAQGTASWDEFFTPAAPRSLDQRISNQPVLGPNLSTIKALFFHFFIESDRVEYELNYRSLILTFWILTLLEAEEHHQHWRLLTNSVFRYEHESLLIPKLAAKFGNLENSVSPTNDLSISELRYAAVMHVIRVSHQQESKAEVEDILGGFEEKDAKALLESIFATMKEIWNTLRKDPDQQDIYTLLIHAALRQFELFPRQDVEIDPWFYDAATFPQPVRNDLFQILGGHGSDDVDTVEKAKELFDLEVEQAGRFDRFEALTTKLQDVLLQRSWDTEPECIKYMLAKHGRFLQVATQYWAYHPSANSRMATETLIRVLVCLMENLHCRAEVDDLPSMQTFMRSILPILHILRDLLSEASLSFKAETFELSRLIYKWTIACLYDIPDNSIDDVEAICEVAAVDDSSQSLSLLEAVVTVGRTMSVCR